MRHCIHVLPVGLLVCKVAAGNADDRKCGVLLSRVPWRDH